MQQQIIASAGKIPLTPVMARLFLGNYGNACELRLANPHDITTVVDCTDFPVMVPKEIEVVKVPFADGFPVSADCLDKALAGIWRGIRDGKVLVHCAAGQSRSPAIVAAYLHRIGFLTFENGIDYIQKIRPMVLVHHEIKISIMKLMRISPYDGTYTDGVN